MIVIGMRTVLSGINWADYLDEYIRQGAKNLQRSDKMTLFTKPECKLCDQLKNKFDLEAMKVHVEVLDNGDAGALAHLAWHGLVETARKTLPILVLDDSSTVDDFSSIEKQLMNRADQFGIRYEGSTIVMPLCDTGTCALN